MSRWKAASIHLSISISVGLMVLALLFLVWYPQPYFGAAGGQALIIILLGVDIVLGPMLTLVLFESGKKNLLLDLCLIAAIQVSALIYGLYVIAQARPVFIVAAIDRFEVVSANEIDPVDLAKGSKAEFRRLSWTGPRLVAAKRPDDPGKRSDLLFSGLAGKDIQTFPEYYVDYADEAASMLAHAKPLADLSRSKVDAALILEAWLKKHHREPSSIVWLPTKARKAALTMLLDTKNGAVLGALPIDPW